MLVTEKKTIETYYQALLDRQESYVRIFFVGVKTTDVFCIATCRARKPKFENVEFFSTFKDALTSGYRPCKICKPTENASQTPEMVESAIKMVKESPKAKITDHQLRIKNISPEVVRTWFKKNYSMTFKTYQRMYRINNAMKELKEGKSTTRAAFETSYASLSGFGYTFKKVMGDSPKNGADKNVILISRFTTPLGPMFVCATEAGVCLLEFTDRKMLETEFMQIQKAFNATIIPGENNHIKQAIAEITAYFDGDRKIFEVALDAPGTDFQKQVWQQLQTIPYGTTATYLQQS
jgi:AraC family transcriptional regulator of adaptative response/methylated-DNA-[protein]-cysteine methyltransferase